MRIPGWLAGLLIGNRKGGTVKLLISLILTVCLTALAGAGIYALECGGEAKPAAAPGCNGEAYAIQAGQQSALEKDAHGRYSLGVPEWALGR